jgi:hypothetical protein
VSGRRAGLLMDDYRKFVADRTTGFVGREWCLEVVADWLRQGAPRIMLIVGEPGCGKSALAGKLTELSCDDAHMRHPEFAPGFLSAVHFCSSGDARWSDPIRFVKSVSEQLAVSCPGFAQALVEEAGLNIELRQEAGLDIEVRQTVTHVESGNVIGLVIEKLVVGNVVPELAFTQLVAGPLERTLRDDPDGRVVLLVDALDESLSWGSMGWRGSIAGLVTSVQHLTPAVRLLLFSRPDATLERRVRRLGAAELSLSMGSRRRFATDLDLFIRQTLTPWTRGRISAALGEDRFVALCAERADGNFLYARHLLAMLEAGSGVIDESVLRTVPAGLDGLYVEYLERITDGASERWDRIGLLLGTLAVALEPLTEQQLAALLGRPQDEIRRDITLLRQLLEEPENTSVGGPYVLYHRSFADFLLDEAKATMFWCPPAQQHHRIAAWYLDRYADTWNTCDDYGLAHLAAHLHEAGEDEQLLNVLRAGFLSAKAAQMRSLRPILEDLRLGLRSALRIERLDAALRMVIGGPLLKRRVRELPSQVIALYAAAGEVDRALEFVAMIDRPLEALWAIGAVVKRLAPRDPQRAATIAASIDDPMTRAYAQLDVLEASTSELTEPELAAACMALAGIFEEVVTQPEFVAHALLRLSRAIGAPSPTVRAALLERAETVLQNRNYDFGIGQALGALAREVVEDDSDRARELFRRAIIFTCSDRENETSAIAAAGYAEELAALDYPAALQTAQHLDVRIGRAHALIRLLDLACGHGELPLALLAEAEAAIHRVRSIAKAEARGWFKKAQVWLGIALVDIDRARATTLIGGASSSMRVEVLSEALKRRRFSPSRALFLASLLDPVSRSARLLDQGRLHLQADDIDAALSVAAGIDYPEWRSHLRAEVAAQLARSDAPQAHEFAREVERDVRSGSPHTVLEVARSLVDVDPVIAARLLEVGAARAHEISAAPETWLAAVEVTLALHDGTRALEFLGHALQGQRRPYEREWVAEAQAVLVREAARRDLSEAMALRDAFRGPATAEALAGALAEGTAERDVNGALAMVPQLGGDDAEGRALAAIVLAAARQADPRTVALMERFLQWNDDGWLDAKADTAARAAAALAPVDPTGAAQLIGIAVRHPYGDWKLIANALEHLLDIHHDGERLANDILNVVREQSIGDAQEQISLFARAVARSFPALALECEQHLYGRPDYRAPVLAAVSASEAGDDRDAHFRAAVSLAQEAQQSWRLDALIEIAHELAPALPAEGRSLTEQAVKEARMLGEADLLATYLSRAAAVRIRLGDDREAVQWLEDACRALAATSGADAGLAMNVVMRVLSDAPPPILGRCLPALLEAAQATDDVVLRRIELLLPLVLQLRPTPLLSYLEELEIGEAAANAVFEP